ncbi:MAG: GntR family transcriptional regulator [Chitinivibrionales bacterium]|nr:GntR family transcriptional regulator [Chitinivibrionales bacterium]
MRSNAVEIARNYLITSIQESRYRNGDTLPRLKDLALEIGVSVPTLCKATGQLKEQGVLEGRTGRRYRISRNALQLCGDLLREMECGNDQKSTGPLKGWERIREDLRRRIVSGHYLRNNPFPSLMELSHEYGSSFRTIRRALDFLCSENVLVPFNRSYTVRSLSVGAGRNRIGFIVMTDRTMKMQLAGLAEDFYRNLESSCTQSNISLSRYSYLVREEEDLLFHDYHGRPCDFDGSDRMLGYLYVVVAPEYKRDRILGRLSHLNKPAAVLDLIGGWEFPRVINRRNFRIFSSAVSPQCGKEIARFLLSLGHRRIAYISPFHQALWSANRLEGLSCTYRDAGLPDSVREFTYNRPPKINIYYRDQALQRCTIAPLHKAYQQWKESVPEYFIPPLDFLFNFHIPERLIPWAEMHHDLDLLFEQALEDNSISAWVAANDEVACRALDFLGRRRIDVPGKISVVGFDDTQPALQQALTTYNFNMQAMAHAMLDHVLHRQSPLLNQSRKTIELEGLIIERKTTGMNLN